MIRCVWLRGSEDLSRVFQVREKVFVEEQGFSLELEQDEYDRKSLHLLVLEDDEPVATGRLFMAEDSLRVGRIAVLKERRKEGFGDLTMRVLLDMVIRMGGERVSLSAQIPVVPFYERYGFVEVGERYEEEGVPHAHMVAEAQALETILYGGCGGGCAGCSGCGAAGADGEQGCGHGHSQGCGHEHGHSQGCGHEHEHSQGCGHEHGHSH